jgi:hypothetical protein
VPYDKKVGEEKTREKLKRTLGGLANVSKYPLPSFKVGTLDRLMQLSDELQRFDVQLEGASKSYEKQYEELFKNRALDQPLSAKHNERKRPKPLLVSMERVKTSGGSKPTSRGPKVAVGHFLKNFTWRLTFSNIPATLFEARRSQFEIDYGNFRGLCKAYNEARAKIKALERKEQGTLLVRSLETLSGITKDDIIQHERSQIFSTVMVVIPKPREQEFLNTYERMEEEYVDRQEAKAKAVAERLQEAQKKLAADVKQHEAQVGKASADGNDQKAVKEQKVTQEHKKVPDLKNHVIPDSARRIEEDSDFVLYRIMIMTRGLSRLKQVCRDQRYTIRDFVYDEKAKDEARDAKQKSYEQLVEKEQKLQRWIEANWSENVVAEAHVKGLRCFIESVLRYGLPIQFCPSMIEIPNVQKERKVRDLLGTLYASLDSAGLTGDVDSPDMMDQAEFGTDFYPYIYLPMGVV